MSTEKNQQMIELIPNFAWCIINPKCFFYFHIRRQLFKNHTINKHFFLVKVLSFTLVCCSAVFYSQHLSLPMNTFSMKNMTKHFSSILQKEYLGFAPPPPASRGL